MKQLTFSQEYIYKDDEDGIPLSIVVTYGITSVRLDAKADPGAAVCLFSNEDGRDLGIPIEQGINLLYLSTYYS